METRKATTRSICRLKSVLALCTLFLLVSCSLHSLAQPAWVKQTPVSPDHYVGIGSATKTPGSSDHIARARDMALEQIASGIAITITGETSQHILEQSGMVRETFESNISSMVKTELEGYELLDSWENNNEYWVYYRLSKSKYRLLLDNRKRVAAAQAFEFLIQGEGALNREEVASALAYYLQAAREIGPYRGMGLRSTGNTNFQYIDVEVFSRLSNLLSSIRINHTPPFIQAKVFQAPSESISIRVNYFSPQGKSIAVTNLPLKAETIMGNCSFERLTSTGNHGITPLRISRINTPGNVQITITPDIATLAGFNESTMKQAIFSELNLPHTTVRVEVNPVRVLIIAREENMDEAQSRSIVAGKVRQHLTGTGWSIVNESMNADYIMYLNASTRAGVERQGIHTAFASGDVSLTESFNMEEVFRRNAGQVNAGGPNFKTAGEQALERLAEKIIEELGNWNE